MAGQATWWMVVELRRVGGAYASNLELLHNWILALLYNRLSRESELNGNAVDAYAVGILMR